MCSSKAAGILPPLLYPTTVGMMELDLVLNSPSKIGVMLAKEEWSSSPTSLGVFKHHPSLV